MALRIRRLLTSRRLAVWLLGATAVWSAVAMSVPQASLDPAAATAWAAAHPILHLVARAVGLDHAFSSPLFMAATTVLLLSTITCAWERTRTAVRRWRAAGTVSRGAVQRLKQRPDLVLATTPGTTGGQALDAAETCVRGLRLKVRRGPQLLEASAGRVGLLGSPVFHWSLVLLIAVILLGRMTRSEGLIGVPVGERVPDVAESYGSLDEGPLFGGHSRLDIAVEEVIDAYSPDGLDLGVAIDVVLRDGDREVARRLAYANHPLRYGSLLVHANDWGLAPSFSLEDSRGADVANTHALVDFLPEDTSSTSSGGFDVTDNAGASRYRVETRVPLLAKEPSVEMTVTDVATSAVLGSATLAVGDAYELPGGERVRLLGVPRYGRLSVADDWSVTPIYALFVIGTLGLSLAIFTPHRRVRVLVVESGVGVSLHVVVQHDRGSAVFRERALDVLGSAGAHSEADASSGMSSSPDGG